MALSFHLLLPQKFPHPLKFQNHPLPSNTLLNGRIKTQSISCSARPSDAELASDLATEVEKMNTQAAQREEAMKRSREILFTELCRHLCLRTEDLKKKWRKMSDEERRGLVKGFVSNWDVGFHPLSAKSVKQLVEEHLGQEQPSPDPSPSLFFPGLKKLMGFSSNN
ncbi:uncharacterized protein LOC131166423 [Malania oleifera]|uniref:uncharacterized protein LOC131166423 n=1 Tax=Malania oleifera TaxID=397392 RepID=UPI0025AE139A|nr:uncharacterized protein LOC131166423 [Malania oleifera]